MARKGEPDLTGMMAMSSVAGAQVGMFASGLLLAIADDVRTLREQARNQKRISDWRKAVVAKSEEADELLAEFDALRRDSLGPYPYLSQRAVEFYLAFKAEYAAAFERQSLYDAYDDLASLVDRIRAEIARTKEVARQVFNERARRQAAKLLKQAEESA